MKKYINVNKETKAKLMRLFGVCERVVRNALTFERNNELARKIRFAALKNGGVTYVINEEMECWHDSDNHMKMVFRNGAEIDADKITGEFKLYFKGDVVATWDNPRVSFIPEIQKQAAAL